ncbi:restriction endonuclease subunit S [Helicobacter pullorum]|uniref:restriction endonuclease subunit S n=1 Tax=Helicobacter pullorum TaxID=35818 RepID=UPI000A542CDB|nr:restriction endonuclease subunit S [Helicobacter pullorum]
MRAYKDSGIEWLGEIPEHWEVVKIKYIFIIGRGRVISQEELDKNGVFPVYSSQTSNNGILGYIKTYDFDYEQITWTTDGVNAGTIFLRSGKYNCTNICGTLKPKRNENMVFLTYALQNATPYYKRPDTNGAKIMNNEMANIEIVYPPIEEQKAIADFLDSKCKLIETFIEKKQKLITLLNEKKQALINECVTKGLDKNVNFKDSGIEHLGAIPTHWEIKRLKYIVSLQNQKSGNIDSLVASLPQNDEYLCHSNDSAFSRHSDLERSEREESHKNNNTNFRIGLENIESKTGKYIPTSEIVFEEDGIKFENGDILFGKLRPYLAKVFLADRGGICVSEFLVLRTKGANNHFLKFLMLSPLFIDIVDSSTYGTKMPRVNWEFIGNLKIPLPPIEEQKQIAKFLDSEISKIDSIIGKIKKQIELIKEYKSTLISQAVCGRIGVQ